jgi:hypothetical protein
MKRKQSLFFIPYPSSLIPHFSSSAEAERPSCVGSWASFLEAGELFAGEELFGHGEDPGARKSTPVEGIAVVPGDQERRRDARGCWVVDLLLGKG